MNTFNINIGGTDYTPYVPFNIKFFDKLDETLDSGVISLIGVNIKTFNILTPVTITVTNTDTNTEYVKAFLISTDNSQEVPIGSGRFKHTLGLIEETKYLEGILVDSLMFKNSLAREYKTGVQLLEPLINVPSGISYITPDNYRSPFLVGNFTFQGEIISYGMTTHANEVHTVNLYENGNLIYTQTVRVNNEPFTVTLKAATYELEYLDTWDGASGASYQASAVYNFVALQNYEGLPFYTITDVVNRVLNLAEPHLKSVSPRFTFNEAQAQEYSTVEAPEFAFTKNTLKEILNEIGGYIHAIPRLKGTEIYFDKLGQGGEFAAISTLAPTGNYYYQDIESYCTDIDSDIDNLVCALAPNEGTISEPFEGSFKTVRTETVYARIEEGNLCIQTQFPIYEVENLTCGYISNRTDGLKGGDITAYLFEKAEYDRMSSYDETYPYSKAYALYFTRGSKNIYGLTYKVPDATGGVFQNYAIVNIINAVTGQNISGTTFNNDFYPLLAFNVTYTPIFNGRLTASKSLSDKTQFKRALTYNQSANLVETRYFGENMKGAVLRLGNVDRTLTYVIKDLSYIPTAGELFDEDYYISEVSVEIQPRATKVQLGLSKDFNRLSSYIGINSMRRSYEVSENQAYQRRIAYKDYIVVGDEFTSDNLMITADGFSSLILADLFIRNLTYTIEVDKAIVQSINYDENNNRVIKTNLLPVMSFSLGNAMVFTFSFEDNYSAGLQSKKSTNGDISGYFTNAVEYCDYYGRIQELAFSLGGYIAPPTSLSAQTTLGLALPQYTASIPAGIIEATTSNPLVIEKNGGEIIQINYEIEFISNRKNLILGSALSRYSPLVGTVTEDHHAKLYILPNKLNKFSSVVNLSGATQLVDYQSDSTQIDKTYSDIAIKFINQQATVSGQAWAIVDSNTNELYIGENIPISAGDELNLPILTLTHNVR